MRNQGTWGFWGISVSHVFQRNRFHSVEFPIKCGQPQPVPIAFWEGLQMFAMSFFLEDIVGISPAESFKPLIFFGDFNLLSALGHWVLNDSMSTVKYEMETRFENSWGQHAWQVKSFWRSSELANVMSGSIYIYIYPKILIAQKYASSFSRQFLESNLKRCYENLRSQDARSFTNS